LVSYVRDRVCETSTTTGTGNLTLAGAVAGFRTFNSSGAAGGSDFYYLIEAVDANGVPTGEWETGIGKCPTTTTLQRLVLLASSTGSLVSFAAGTKRVHLTAPAYQLGWNGAVAFLGSDLTTQNFTTAAAIPWSGTNPDTDSSSGTGDGYFDAGNHSRITIPSLGYDSATIDVRAQVSLSNITVADWVELKFRLNGSSIIGRQTFIVPTTTPSFQVGLAQPLTVGFSDYVELMIQVGADNSISVLSADTYLTLEVRQ
jgi:hypothetical protein